MMLNKIALEAARRTLRQLLAADAAFDSWPLPIIEAFLAALPDEDGLVKKLRTEATIAGTQRQGRIAWVLGKAADALEASRTKPDG